LTLLPVRAAASRLGIGYSTLKQWIYAGRVRTIETAGGHHRVPEAEIERLSTEPPPQRGRQKPLHGRTAITVLGNSNRLCGHVEEVRSDGLVAQIGLRVGDHRLTAVITAEALNDLGLRRGDDAVAIIKSTDVVIAKESIPTEKSRRRRRRKD
jgi:molybdopterin-binding protein